MSVLLTQEKIIRSYTLASEQTTKSVRVTRPDNPHNRNPPLQLHLTRLQNRFKYKVLIGPLHAFTKIHIVIPRHRVGEQVFCSKLVG